MDYGSLLSSFGFADGNRNNSFIWIIIIIVIIFFGKPGLGLGGNVALTGGMGGCCCTKHHHHSNCCCRRAPNVINPLGMGGYGGYEWIFVILILALVFLLNNEDRTQVEC
jgi:hypothetical protein